VIPLQRPPLDEELTRLLAGRTARLMADPRPGAAREHWRAAGTVRRRLRAVLEPMAPGLVRCMYCGDSRGTDIDHFEPLARAPHGAFDWANHLLACGHCNSNHKRDRFPVDPGTGAALLVDPSREDPHDHLRLALATGRYAARTPRGDATIDVFGLNRAELERGRAMAYDRCRSMLRDWAGLCAAGDPEADRVRRALTVQPFADVLYGMLRVAGMPGADVVLGGAVLAALLAWARDGVGIPA
jgi:hypothetical protein